MRARKSLLALDGLFGLLLGRHGALLGRAQIRGALFNLVLKGGGKAPQFLFGLVALGDVLEKR